MYLIREYGLETSFFFSSHVTGIANTFSLPTDRQKHIYRKNQIFTFIYALVLQCFIFKLYSLLIFIIAKQMAIVEHIKHPFSVLLSISKVILKQEDQKIRRLSKFLKMDLTKSKFRNEGEKNFSTIKLYDSFFSGVSRAAKIGESRQASTEQSSWEIQIRFSHNRKQQNTE